MNKTYKTIGIVIAVVVVVIGIGISLNNNTATPATTGSESLGLAPDFSLEDYDGTIVSLSDFEGQPLVINAWAAWCPFCRNELPDFAEAQKQFGDDVTFIAIDRAESLEIAKGYTDEIGVTDDMVFLLDPDDTFYKSIGGFTMPETIFVNAQGEITFHKRGPMTLEEVTERVTTLLGETL